jgi:hypothetical protein
VRSGFCVPRIVSCGGEPFGSPQGAVHTLQKLALGHTMKDPLLPNSHRSSALVGTRLRCMIALNDQAEDEPEQAPSPHQSAGFGTQIRLETLKQLTEHSAHLWWHRDAGIGLHGQHHQGTRLH